MYSYSEPNLIIFSNATKHLRERLRLSAEVAHMRTSSLNHFL
jgi:hypothetical protein